MEINIDAKEVAQAAANGLLTLNNEFDGQLLQEETKEEDLVEYFDDLLKDVEQETFVNIIAQQIVVDMLQAMDETEEPQEE